ncbi:hypothetical protein JSO19_08695 [Leucobacter sp. UCMA 4100]|uniref:hypothetical protein n=1 Tax=Leucobacter sp. UCMA 4100 TaxID=2810534 RepID=UPI0022EA539E|nr:hypothetical protein [Leucobacter sp. UCMA 4100]MDA3147457.1 hypothetical protein [Leucobacter sp. UCMA 4100]
MLTLLRLTVFLLWNTWPQLVAWFLAGTIIRYSAIEVAGFVGAHNPTAGMLLLPLAVLGRLGALVAMLLVLRSGIDVYNDIEPPGREQRNRDFTAALLAGLLPFVAFYAARGYLGQDVAAYTNRVLDVSAARTLSKAVTAPGQDVVAGEMFTDGALTLTPLTVAIIVAAFSLRWLWGKFRDRLHRSFQVFAVYLELLWVYLTVTLIADGLALLTGWIETRQAIAWLDAARLAVTEWFAPLMVAWDTLVIVLAFVAKVTLEPLAWLTIAGVIYGQTLEAKAPVITDYRAVKARKRYEAVPEQVRRRFTDLSGGVTSRFKPIWNAIILMWRAGPALIGAYVLAFTAVLMAQQLLEIAVVRVIGPHDLHSFWMVADTLILLTVPLVIEPIRMAVVASAHAEATSALAVTTVVSTAPEPFQDLQEAADEQSSAAPRQ